MVRVRRSFTCPPWSPTAAARCANTAKNRGRETGSGSRRKQIAGPSRSHTYLTSYARP